MENSNNKKRVVAKALIASSIIALVLIFCLFIISDFNLNRAKVNYDKQINNQLTLIADITKESLQKGQFDTIKNFFSSLGIDNEYIVYIKLKSNNGFIIAEYNSDKKNSSIISINKELRFSYDKKTILEFGYTYKQIIDDNKDDFIVGMILILIISFVFFYIIYQSIELKIHKILLEDSIDELKKNRDSLEDIVKERTVELTTAIISAEHAIESAEKAKESAEQAKDIAINANIQKSRFLSNMSHELRTPMHSILSFSKFGIDKTSEENSKKYFSNINVSAERLMTLINDLLDISKLESGKMDVNFEKASLSKIIEDQLESLSALIQEKNIELDVNVSKNLRFNFDVKLINQLLVNFYSNAIKFTESKISIEAKKINLNKNNENLEYALIKISDNGIGIPEDEKEYIFSPFAQSSKTRTEAGGTGLGLAICHEIINIHNGSISIQSPCDKYKKGTCFEILIPTIIQGDVISPIVWTSKFSVGIPVLDTQHKKIIKLINKIIELDGNFEPKDFHTAIKELSEYVEYHLNYEEELLEHSGFNKFNEHVLTHDKFKEKINDFSTRSIGNEKFLRNELVVYLEKWIKAHIFIEDKQYSDWLYEYLYGD